MLKRRMNEYAYQTAVDYKNLGVKYVYSIVKSFYNTTYYHVVAIDKIIEEQRWIPAPKVSMMPWHGRIGVSHLPEHSIHRSQLYK